MQIQSICNIAAGGFAAILRSRRIIQESGSRTRPDPAFACVVPFAIYFKIFATDLRSLPRKYHGWGIEQQASIANFVDN